MAAIFLPEQQDHIILYTGSDKVRGITFYYKTKGSNTQWYDPSGAEIQDPRKTPTELQVEGSWLNQQKCNDLVDTEGLVFNVKYEDSTTEPIDASLLTKSPKVWSGTAGEQTCTFSYTEKDTTVNCSKKANVTAGIPIELTITGDWTNTQYVNASVDYTGLVFTCTYSSGATSTVTPTALNPTTWSSTAGTQTCTFSYTEEGVTVTAQKSASVQEQSSRLKVGGRIFYIHNDNGATYTFYDQQGNVLPTQTVAGLATAYEYEISGTPSADKFYVYDSTNGLATDMEWGKHGTSIGVTYDGIGLGKTNTATCLAQSDWESDSIFSYVQSVNTAQTGGCNDWFIGSEAEQDQLISSGLVDWYSSNYIWSSVEDSPYDAYGWNYNDSNWGRGNKDFKLCVVPLRAF